MTGHQEFACYCFAIGGVQFGLVAAFLRRLWAEAQSPREAHEPPISVIIPCKGVPDGFEDNVRSFLGQDYGGRVEFIFVTPAEDDPAYARLAPLMDARCRLLPSRERPRTCSGKIVDLLCAVERASGQSELLVFADCDLRVRQDWLRSLCAPMKDVSVAVATTCALYVPTQASLCALLKFLMIAWYQPVLMHVPWVVGHSYALRRRDFISWGVPQVWERSVLEDMALTRVVLANGGRIVFTLRSMPVSLEGCSFGETLTLLTKWFAMGRVYNPIRWALLLVAAFGKLAVLAWILWPLRAWDLAALFLLAEMVPVWLLIWGHERVYPGRFSDSLRHFRNLPLATAVAAPLLQCLVIPAAAASIFIRVIRWAGRSYRLQGIDSVEVVEDAG